MWYRIEEEQLSQIDDAVHSLKFVRSLLDVVQDNRHVDIKPMELLAYVHLQLCPLDQIAGAVREGAAYRDGAKILHPSDIGNSEGAENQAQATLPFGPMMWFLRALREGPTVLDDADMVAAIDAGMTEAKTRCEEWRQLHDHWRATVEWHQATSASRASPTRRTTKAVRRAA